MRSTEANGDPSSANCVLFVSASRFLAGPGRSLLTVLEHGSNTLTEQVLLAPPGQLLEVARSIGDLTVVAIPFHPRYRRMFRLLASIAVARQIWQRRHRLVAVHANGLSELSLTAVGSRLATVRVVAWSHSSVVSRLTRLLVRVWSHWMPSLAWAAVSPEAADVVAQAAMIDRSRIAIVPNPIAASQVVAPRVPRDGPIRIGYLSGATRNKGFDVVAEAIELLEAMDVEWCLYSEFKNRRAMTELLDVVAGHPKVKVMGLVTDVAQAYAEVDIVFVPSRRESFGRVAAEAMLNGIPVVASKIPTLERMVGPAGLFFRVGDARAAAEAISTLANDVGLYAALAREGPRLAAEFGPRPVRDQLDELYGLAAFSR